MSILLKPFSGRIKMTSGGPELPPDTLLALSMIDSGCLFVLIGSVIALIIKSAGEDIRAMKKFQAITIDFELIERPEFPSLAFYLCLEGKSGTKSHFEYFFSTESEGETDILRKMCDDRRFDIILYNSGVEFVISAEISEGQSSELRSLVTKACASLTSMPLP